MNPESIHQTNAGYWDRMGNEALGAIVLPLYGAYTSEEHCRLFGDVSGKKLLEIGCGDGQSLQYHGERGAGELWGLDLSEGQLERAGARLDSHGISAKLICSPMEAACGIPEQYFDYVYSIYAIGWTADLPGTFRRIASYLKQGGVFIFSWSHPIHKCVAEEDGRYVFRKSYFDESWYSPPAELCRGELALSDRKLSTYVNALAGAGFAVERMIEETHPDLLPADARGGGFTKRAELFPVTFVIKARKL